jgi:transcription factor WhiB
MSAPVLEPDRDWQRYAYCKHAPDPDAWIYDGRDAVRTPERAHAMCSPCIVRHQCAIYTLQLPLPVECVQAGKPWGRVDEIADRQQAARQLAAEHGLPAPVTLALVETDPKPAPDLGRCRDCDAWLRPRSGDPLGPGEAYNGGNHRCERHHQQWTRSRRDPPPRPIKRRVAERDRRVALATELCQQDMGYQDMKTVLVERTGCSRDTADKYIAQARKQLNLPTRRQRCITIAVALCRQGMRHSDMQEALHERTGCSVRTASQYIAEARKQIAAEETCTQP